LTENKKQILKQEEINLEKVSLEQKLSSALN
jgi:hypothetical protein